MQQQNEECVSKKKEVRIYVRISDRERALNGYGLNRQIKKCKEYLNLYDLGEDSNMKLCVDDGYSGKSMDRPAMRELLQEINDGQVDLVIIYKLDRLSRNVINVYEFISLAVKKECNLVAVVDSIDIHSANGRLAVGILALFAQWERELVIERTNDALLQMCETGLYPVGYVPLGYTKVDNKLLVNEEEKNWVIEIFKQTNEGKLPMEVYRNICSAGFPYRYANPGNFIKNVLSRKLYTGEFMYKGKVYYNIAPQIVSMETFLDATAMQGKRYRENHSERYYFGYKVKCFCCRSILECKSTKKKQGSTVRRYYYYFCNQCKKRINQESILEDVLYRIQDNVEEQTIKERKTKSKNALTKVNRKIDAIYDQYIAEEIDERTYLFTLGKLQTEKDNLLREMKIDRKGSQIHWDKLSDLERKMYIQKNLGYIVVDLNLKHIVKIVLGSQ